MQEGEAAAGGGGAVGEFGGVDGEGPVEGGVLEQGPKPGPVDGAFAEGRGLGASGGTAECVAGTEVVDAVCEVGEDFVGFAGFLQQGDGVEVEAEERAGGGGEGAVQRPPRAEAGAEGDGNAEGVGGVAEVAECAVEECFEGLVPGFCGGCGGGGGWRVGEEDGPGEEGIDVLSGRWCDRGRRGQGAEIDAQDQRGVSLGEASALEVGGGLEAASEVVEGLVDVGAGGEPALAGGGEERGEGELARADQVKEFALAGAGEVAEGAFTPPGGELDAGGTDGLSGGDGVAEVRGECGGEDGEGPHGGPEFRARPGRA